MARKTTANNGFIKEITKPAKPGPAPSKAFTYNKPVSKVDKIQNMAVNSRTREHKTARSDNSTNFAIEQTNAKHSHKGSK